MKLVILDRDGVINHDSDQFIKSPDEWKPIAGSLEAIARLNQAGYQVVIATNQSGVGRGLRGHVQQPASDPGLVGRGLLDMATLNAIHDRMHRKLALAGGQVAAVFYCPHAAEANCGCRKPRAGLYEEIGRRFGVPLAGVPAVGDALRDLQAAATVGARPMLVLTGKGQATRRAGGLPEGTPVFANLADAVEAICG